MNEAVRDVLVALIAERGVALARDRVRLGGFLRDEIGAAKREINVLLDAIDEGVVADLSAPGDEPIDAAIARLAARLVSNRGTHPDAARWSVLTWAVALGRLAPDAADAAPARPAAGSDPRRDLPPPPPAPGGLLTQLLGFFRTPAGKPRWMPIGLALVAVGGLLAVRLADDKAPRIVRVDLASTVFDGSKEIRAKLVGDGRRYPARIWFEDKDGDVASLLIRNLNGVWASGNDTNTRALNLAGRVSGAIDTETFSFTGTGSAQVSLVLVDAAGRRSAAFPVQYDAEAPPKPAAGQGNPGARVRLPFNLPPVNVPNLPNVPNPLKR